MYVLYDNNTRSVVSSVDLDLVLRDVVERSVFGKIETTNLGQIEALTVRLDAIEAFIALALTHLPLPTLNAVLATLNLVVFRDMSED